MDTLLCYMDTRIQCWWSEGASAKSVPEWYQGTQGLAVTCIFTSGLFMTELIKTKYRTLYPYDYNLIKVILSRPELYFLSTEHPCTNKFCPAERPFCLGDGSCYPGKNLYNVILLQNQQF